MSRLIQLFPLFVVVACTSPAEPPHGQEAASESERVPYLDGMYRASGSAAVASMLFDSQGRYASRPEGCADEESSCLERGTYTFSDGNKALTLTSSVGQSTRYTFDRLDRASVTTQSVTPLSGDDRRSETDNRLVKGDATLLDLGDLVVEAFKLGTREGGSVTLVAAAGDCTCQRSFSSHALACFRDSKCGSGELCCRRPLSLGKRPAPI